MLALSGGYTYILRMVSDTPSVASTHRIRKYVPAAVTFAATMALSLATLNSCGPPSLGNIYVHSRPCDGTQETETLMSPTEAQDYADRHGQDPSSVCFTGINSATSATWYVSGS